jgi:hypothetical protein
VGLEILREAKDAGTLRGDVDVEFALDSLTGQLLARAWQGAPLDDAWLARTWEQLWAGLTLR